MLTTSRLNLKCCGWRYSYRKSKQECYFKNAVFHCQDLFLSFSSQYAYVCLRSLRARHINLVVLLVLSHRWGSRRNIHRPLYVLPGPLRIIIRVHAHVLSSRTHTRHPRDHFPRLFVSRRLGADARHSDHPFPWKVRPFQVCGTSRGILANLNAIAARKWLAVFPRRGIGCSFRGRWP